MTTVTCKMSHLDVQPLKKKQYKAKENKDPLNPLHVSVHWRTHTLGIFPLKERFFHPVMEEILAPPQISSDAENLPSTISS